LKFIKLFVVILVFLLDSNAKDLEKVKLQLQWKHQFEFAGFYAAKEKGFYADVGLDVEFIEFSKNTNISDEVLNHRADYGLSYSSIILDYLNGKPLVLLANFFKQSPLVLVAQKDIKTPADLKNKKIMGISNTIDNITLLTMLNKFGIKLNDIVNIKTNFMLDKFINKEVDAMSVFTTNEIYHLDEMGIKYNIFDPVSYGTKYYDANLFTSEYEILNHPKRADSFRKASIKGWEYALSHKEEIIELILKKYNTQNKSKKALLFEAKQLEYIMLPKVYKIGSIDVNRLEIIADNFVQSGFLDKRKNKDLKFFIYKKDNGLLNLTDKEKSFIKKHSEITLGIDNSWAPYVITSKGGTISGYDNEVLSLINKLSGANFKLVTGNWSDMQDRAKLKKIDGLSCGIISEKRKRYLNLSYPYVNIQKLIITTKDNPSGIESIKDLVSKKIAIQKDNILEEKIASRFKNSNIIRFDNLDEKINSLMTGKIDAAIGDNILFYRALILDLPNFKASVSLDENTPLVFGVRKDWPEAISIINKALLHIGKQKLLELKNKWFIGASSVDHNNIKLSYEELNYLKQKKQILMCVDPQWMPFEKIQNHKHMGLAADYMKIISNMIDTPIKLVETSSWIESLQKAKNRECDILSIASINSERKKYMNFSIPYIQRPIVLATKRNVNFVDDLNLYMDKTFAVVKGYSILSILKQRYKDIKIIEVNSIHDGLKKVERDEVFGLLESSLTMNYEIQNNFSNSILISGRLDDKIKFSIASRSDETILNDIFNKALNSIDLDIREKISNKWLTFHNDKKIDYTLLWQILGLVLVVLLLGLYRQFLLNRANKHLKQSVMEATKDLEVKNKYLYHQAKMASMGEMIQNIAHQWRQPLAQVNSSVLVIDATLNKNNYENEIVEKKLLEIESLTQYMSKTINDFQNFFSPDKELEQFSIKNAIDNSLSIVSSSLSSIGVRVIADVNITFKAIAYKNELQQVIVVILNNAKDAFSQVNTDNKMISIDVKNEKDFYSIYICDNAGGIKEDMVEKVFEPYFTTKHKSQGTGLGLYISKMIIEDGMKGHLSVENKDDGACFKISLLKERREDER